MSTQLVKNAWKINFDIKYMSQLSIFITHFSTFYYASYIICQKFIFSCISHTFFTICVLTFRIGILPCKKRFCECQKWNYTLAEFWHFMYLPTTVETCCVLELTQPTTTVFLSLSLVSACLSLIVKSHPVSLPLINGLDFVQLFHNWINVFTFSIKVAIKQVA